MARGYDKKPFVSPPLVPPVARPKPLSTTDYGTAPSHASEPKQAPTYLQSTDNDGPSGMGPMFGPMKDPEAAGPPKSLKRQDMGSVVGRRGAGLSQITGGDQGAHSVNHYGKKGKPGGGFGGLVGGGLL